MKGYTQVDPPRNGSMGGAQLRELRLASQLTQKDVGSYVGVNQRTVSSWEREIMHPSAEHVQQLKKLFGNDLLGHIRDLDSIDSG